LSERRNAQVRNVQVTEDYKTRQKVEEHANVGIPRNPINMSVHQMNILSLVLKKTTAEIQTKEILYGAILMIRRRDGNYVYRYNSLTKMNRMINRSR
jgi:hypothetical protein